LLQPLPDLQFASLIDSRCTMCRYARTLVLVLLVALVAQDVEGWDEYQPQKFTMDTIKRLYRIFTKGDTNKDCRVDNQELRIMFPKVHVRYGAPLGFYHFFYWHVDYL